MRLSPEAQADLVRMHTHITEASGSSVTADRYLDRISGFLSSLNVFPERGTIRDEARSRLPIIGFGRSASVAFIVEDDDVIALRILAKGQDFDESTGE